MKWWDWDAVIFVFWMLSFKPTFSLSSFTFTKRLFSSSSVCAIRVVSSAYLRLLIFLPAILIPAVLYPAQHFSWFILRIGLISKMTIHNLDVFSRFGTSLFFSYLVLTIASWPSYRFLRRQVKWSGISISWRIFHSLLWSTQSKALAQSIKQK